VGEKMEDDFIKSKYIDISAEEDKIQSAEVDIKLTNMPLAIMTMVKALVGSGILGLPYAFRCGGFYIFIDIHNFRVVKCCYYDADCCLFKCVLYLAVDSCQNNGSITT
jgi:hypothetical protein